MARKRVVRREVREETADDATTTSATPTEPRAVDERVVEVEEEETVETRRPASGVTNVNVNKDPVSGNVSVNTPDGTQVNINK
jgi:hypothetical protein